jgi:PPOX class probable F420-dependent enzyme
MHPLDQFGGQPYLNLETLRRNGQAMLTPLWFVQDGETLYVRTAAESGKVKRVRNTPRVRVAVCGREGQLLGPWVTATASEVRDDPFIETKVDQLLDIKYGEVKRQMARQAAEAGRKYTILEIILEKKP